MKINKLPEDLEDTILSFINLNDKLVLGGSLALYILDIMGYDFKRRNPDIDFSLTEPFEESEFNHLINFLEYRPLLRSTDDYTAISTSNPEELSIIPKPTEYFLKKELIQVKKLYHDNNGFIIKEQIVDFFNKDFLKVKDYIELDYFGTTIKITHPSIIFSYKMKYATDSRVGKQFKHFQDIQNIDWGKYFKIMSYTRTDMEQYIEPSKDTSGKDKTMFRLKRIYFELEEKSDIIIENELPF
jgi:hypothetical protein